MIRYILPILPKDSLRIERFLTQTAAAFYQRKQQPPSTNANSLLRTQTAFYERKMNSSIMTSYKRAYHTFANVEFTGVVDITPENVNIDYHLFIRYGNMVYMDAKGIGEVVITYEELQKNKYWKYYYDLSLIFAKDKHLVVQELEDTSDYLDYQIYDTDRIWSINNLYIIGNELHQYGDIGISDIYEKVAYYKVNPYDLENMEYTSQEDLEVFRKNYISSRINNFETKRLAYNNLAIEHLLKNMEGMSEEIEELQAFFVDKKQSVNIITSINDKYIMNEDIIRFIINTYLY
jgi:hypothetical protein